MQPDLAKFCNFGTILGRCPGTDSIKVLHYTNFLIILIGRKICFRQSKCSKTCAVNIGPWKIFRGFIWILAKFSTYFDKFVILLYKFFLLQNCLDELMLLLTEFCLLNFYQLKNKKEFYLVMVLVYARF